MSASPDQHELVKWIASLGLDEPLPGSWQHSLRAAPEKWDDVINVLSALPIAAGPVVSMARFASPELLAAAKLCQAQVRRLNAIIAAKGRDSDDWIAAHADYLSVVQELQSAGQRHRQQVAAALASWKIVAPATRSTMLTVPRHGACSDVVRDRIWRLKSVLERRHGAAHPPQPKRMADALGSLGLRRSYFITSIDNIGSICKVGLLPHALAPRERTDISKPGIQQNRAAVSFVGHDGAHRQLHEFVPMFYAPKTPMLWERSDPRSGVGKENLCLLEFEIQRLADWSEELVVTDRNAATRGVRFGADPSLASIVPRDIILRSSWSDITDGAPRRSAELLCYPLIPAPAILSVHVCSESVGTRVRSILKRDGCFAPVEVSPGKFPQY